MKRLLSNSNSNSKVISIGKVSEFICCSYDTPENSIKEDKSSITDNLFSFWLILSLSISTSYHLSFYISYHFRPFLNVSFFELIFFQFISLLLLSDIIYFFFQLRDQPIFDYQKSPYYYNLSSELFIFFKFLFVQKMKFKFFNVFCLGLIQFALLSSVFWG